MARLHQTSARFFMPPWRWQAWLFLVCGCLVVSPADLEAAGSNFLLYLPAFIKNTGFAAPPPGIGSPPAPINRNYAIIAWNDLGMHCMDPSYEDFAVLPPYNTLHAQVIQRAYLPTIVTQGITVQYRILGNTRSDNKTNFWQYAQRLFSLKQPLTPNIGLKGAGLAGNMTPAADSFVAEGIPLTEYLDSDLSRPYPYQVAEVVARNASGSIIASTQTVAPVSTEMHCEKCHGDNGAANRSIATGKVKTNILTLHDQRHRTTLMAQRPVLCASCHGSNALSLPGKTGVSNLSLAIHGRHARAGIDDGTMNGTCYLCHPGPQTKCLRDSMFQKGLTCYNCHGTLTNVAAATRRPWLDEPRCASCHGATFGESAGVLYRKAKGHQGIYCEACHGSPHAITPTTEANDNVQATLLQGHAGTINTCTVCHIATPSFGGPHHDIAMHPTGNTWVSAHEDANKSNCALCHGTTSAGTPYGAVKVATTINAGEYGIKRWPAGYQVSCYSCHNGPDPD